MPFNFFRPVDYTNKLVLDKPVWADRDLKTEAWGPGVQWNSLDGKVDRTSHMGKYDVVSNLPR